MFRTEATGYGLGDFVQEMLAASGDSLAGKTCLVSGARNVAVYAIEQVRQLGGKVVACSDSQGVDEDCAGIDPPMLKRLKEVERLPINPIADRGSKRNIRPAEILGRSIVMLRYPVPGRMQSRGQNRKDDAERAGPELIVEGGRRTRMDSYRRPSPRCTETFVSWSVVYSQF